MRINSKSLKSILPLRALAVALIFGLISFLTIVGGINFYLPGTGAVSDPREIFNSIGAAFSGPIGGIIIGILSTLNGQESHLKYYVMFQHVVSAIWIGWAYKKLVYEKYKMPYLLLGWLFLIFIYSYVIYLPGLIILHFMYNPLFQELAGGPLSLWDAVIKLYGGWLPETIFTTIYTTILFIALPEKFRKPVWGVEKEKNASPEGLTKLFVPRFFLKNFIAIRLSIWFILLFSIPLVYLTIFNRNYFLEYFLQNEAKTQYEAVHHVASLLERSTPEEIPNLLSRINENDERTIIVLDLNFNSVYKNSVGQKKIYNPVFTSQQRQHILEKRSGTLTDIKGKAGIGFSLVKNKSLIVFSISPGGKYESDMNNLVLLIYKNLGLALLVISLLSGAIIWIIIGKPLKKLREVADEIGRQNYDVLLDDSELTDEIKTLAVAVNKMKSNIKVAENIINENELKFRLLFETANDAIFILRKDVFVNCNSKTLELFGGFRDEIIGHSVLEFSPEVQSDGVNSDFKAHEKINAALSDKPQFFEWTHIKKDGTVFEVEVSLNKIRLKDEYFLQTIVRDITERKREHQALQLSEAKFKGLISSMQDLVYTLDLDMKIIGLYGMWSEMYGLSEELLIGKKLTTFLSPAEAMINDAACSRALNGESVKYEWSLRKDDDRFFFESSLTPLFGVNGEIIGVAGVAREITERKKAETRIMESEERYRKLFNFSPDPIIVHKRNKIIFINAAGLRLFGAQNHEQIIGRDILDFVHPEFHTIVKERMLRLIDGEEELDVVEEKFVKMDGSIIDVQTSTISFPYEGEIAAQVVVRDITEEKRAYEQLKKLSQAVHQSPVSIVITDTNANIEYINPKFTKVTGYSLEEVISRNPRILKSGAQSKEFYEEMWKTLASGNDWQGELHNRKKSGELYWEFASISPIKNNLGKTTHYVAVKEDITDRKRNQEDLLKSKIVAEEANKLKSSLLANMSHEFRTPLNGILGFSQLLRDEISDSDQLDMIEKIMHSGKRLMNTLNSVLTLTELEHNDYLISKSEIELTIFCKELKAKYLKQALNKNLELVLDLKCDSLSVVTDENVFTKILSSILENAIKYTHRGEIRIELSESIDGEGLKRAVVAIIDTGIGIRESDQKIIFGEFKQLSEGSRRDYEGLGLGLSLANKMVKLIGGSISVQSEIGKGSKFTLMLPIETSVSEDKAETKQILTGPESSIRPKIELERRSTNVLLVEDNPLNIEVVQKFLSKTCNVIAARDGLTAVRLCKEDDYSLIMIDINLGRGMNGTEVLEEIRKLKKYDHVPIIALTGYASESNKKEFLAQGFSHYLAKPFEKSVLVKLIGNILNSA